MKRKRQFVASPDDPIMTVNAGKFQMIINQKYVESLTGRQRQKFWAVIGRTLKIKQKESEK